MLLKRELRSSDLSGRVLFWTGGNKPTQEVFKLTTADVAESLRASFLVSDTVVASASYYLESNATRHVVRRHAPLFSNGEILFFVDESIESYAEHGARKIEKSPASLDAYSRPEVIAKKAEELTELGFLLRRPADSISALLVRRWENDLMTASFGSLGAMLDSLPLPSDRVVALRLDLIRAARGRSTDFVWEVVVPILDKHKVDPVFRRLARERLAAFYGEETAKLLNATVDASDHRITSDIRGSTDVSLFLRMLYLLNAHEAFRRLKARECIGLKQSPEWMFFWSFYNNLHSAVSDIEVAEMPMLKVFQEAERRWRSGGPQKRGISRKRFLNVVQKMVSVHTTRAHRFSKPLDFMLDVCDNFHRCPISDFVGSLKESASKTSLLMRKSRRPKAVGIITIKPVELDAVKALMEQRGPIEEREGQLIRRRFWEENVMGHDDTLLPVVCLRALDQGNPSAQSACYALLSEYDVRLLVLLGIAGGIHKKIRLCDVVIADAVYNYERRAITDAGVNHRLDAYKMSATVAELFSRFAETYGEEAEIDATPGSANSKFITRKAPIGSGEAVIKSKLAEVRAWLELINENVMAVETEAIGASHVEHELELYNGNKPIGLLIVRGISDHSDHEKNDKYQRLASDNACIVLDKILQSYAPSKQWGSPGI